MPTSKMFAPPIQMAVATENNLDVVFDMLNAARTWLARVGVPQWQAPFTNEEMETAVRDGRVILARDQEGTPLGSLQLSFESDPVWGTRAEGAGYVHRFVVARDATGKGVGSAMLDWAQTQGQTRGYRALRLYCAQGNEKLIGHYFSLGFAVVGASAAPRAADGSLAPVTLLERLV